MKSALKVSRFFGLNFDWGAPGQSTLNKGLAMSVTRNLARSRRRRASATSLLSSLTIFLFHMLRSSIHSRPNSFETISTARAKSWEISSLMTAIRKGEFISRSPVVRKDSSCLSGLIRLAIVKDREHYPVPRLPIRDTGRLGEL